MVLAWAKDWVMDKVYGAAKTGIQAGGSMAGNAVGGVGSLVENSGRGLGQSTSGFAGAIGGVGNYINSYGQGIIDSTAASGEKKTAVKPAASQKSLPAAKTVSALAPSKAVASSTPKPSTPKPLNQQPSKPPPPAPNRNLPSKKPSPQFPQKPAGATSLTKISASAADRTADGKIRISPSSRPQPVRPPGGGVGKGPVKSVQANGGPKPLPRIAAGKGDRTADGKIRISQASRPRPVVSAR